MRDGLNGGIVDFRYRTRERVDDKSLDDLRLLCRRQISRIRETALASCLSTGGPASYGAQWLDADLDQPGTQKTGPRRTVDPG